MAINISFHGAARQVTGSMFLLQSTHFKVLVDCGMDFEKDRGGKSGELPFDPAELDLVVLTHAHLDHSGLIPNLYRAGYEGKVICSLPTYYLTALLLMDSAKLNLRKISSQGKSKKNKVSSGDLRSLYLEADVAEALKYFHPIPFSDNYTHAEGLKIRLNPASHLLGAANVIVEFTEDGEKTKIGFSGDLGRRNYPLLPDPQPMEKVDYLVCESTYGGRYHRDTGHPEDIVEQVIREACVDIPGKLIIPAFSIGRTQALLFTLFKLYGDGRLPQIPIYVDSPLAIESTRVHEKLKRYLSKEAREMLDDGEELFDFENLNYISKSSHSRYVSDHFEPAIILTSSGMMEGGRVQYHIRQNIENAYCTVFMVGYAAEGTLGRKIMDGAEYIYVEGRRKKVNARIVQTDVFSGHGDHEDLLRFVENQDSAELRNIFLVHGEPKSQQELRKSLEARGYKGVLIPHKGMEFSLQARDTIEL